jgi:hypothetical protein
MVLAPILRRSDIILLQRELAEDAGGIVMSGNGIRISSRQVFGEVPQQLSIV